MVRLLSELSVCFIVTSPIEIPGFTPSTYVTWTGWDHYMCRSIRELGHEAVLIAPSRKIKTIISSRHAFGHKVIFVPVGLPNTKLWPSGFSFSLLKVISKVKTNLIHIHNCYSFIYDSIALTCKMFKIPFVTQHNAGSYESLPSLVRFYRRITLHFAARVLSPNLGEINVLIRKAKLPSNKIAYVPMGVDTALFRPISKEKSRQILGLKNGSLYILFVGRLSPLKGLDVLVDAFVDIAKKYSRVNLILVGPSTVEEKMYYQKKIKSLGLEKRIQMAGIFPGRILVLYYNAADIFVFPSLSETFGVALIEALSCGLPVVSSYTGVAPNVIRNGENGFLINPGSKEELIDRVSLLLDNIDLRSEFGKKSRQISLKYDWKNIGEKLIKIYKEIGAVK
jgi:glycosyltransferase involved in cell wall biosynthesis